MQQAAQRTWPHSRRPGRRMRVQECIKTGQHVADRWCWVQCHSGTSAVPSASAVSAPHFSHCGLWSWLALAQAASGGWAQSLAVSTPVCARCMHAGAYRCSAQGTSVDDADRLLGNCCLCGCRGFRDAGIAAIGPAFSAFLRAASHSISAGPVVVGVLLCGSSCWFGGSTGVACFVDVSRI